MEYSRPYCFFRLVDALRERESERESNESTTNACGRSLHTYTFDDDTAFTLSLDFDPDGLDAKPATVKEFTLLALLVAGLVLGDPANGDLSPFFSLTLLAWLGLGELLAE